MGSVCSDERVRYCSARLCRASFAREKCLTYCASAYCIPAAFVLAMMDGPMSAERISWRRFQLRNTAIKWLETSNETPARMTYKWNYGHFCERRWLGRTVVSPQLKIRAPLANRKTLPAERVTASLGARYSLDSHPHPLRTLRIARSASLLGVLAFVALNRGFVVARQVAMLHTAPPRTGPNKTAATDDATVNCHGFSKHAHDRRIQYRLVSVDQRSAIQRAELT